MDNYLSVIDQIKAATSLNQITEIVDSFSAKAVGSGGVLYTGVVGNGFSAGQIANEIASANNLNIIDKTPRGLLLGEPRPSRSRDDPRADFGSEAPGK